MIAIKNIKIPNIITKSLFFLIIVYLTCLPLLEEEWNKTIILFKTWQSSILSVGLFIILLVIISISFFILNNLIFKVSSVKKYFNKNVCYVVFFIAAAFIARKNTLNYYWKEVEISSYANHKKILNIAKQNDFVLIINAEKSLLLPPKSKNVDDFIKLCKKENITISK